jgi:hypothetical protein
MISQRVFPGVAAFACLGAMVFLFYSARESREVRESLGEWEARQRAMAAELRRAEQRTVAAEKELVDLHARLAAQPVERPVAAESPAPVRRAAPPSMDELIASDGPLHALAEKAERTQINERYRQLFQALRLTPAESEAFTDNAIKRWERTMDLNNLRRSGSAADRAAIRTLIGTAEEEYRAAQKDLLGEAGFGEFERFERTAEPRSLVSQVAGAAALRGFALSPDQAGQLVRNLVSASERFQSGKNAGLSEGLDWTKIDAEAATILSPAQLALWKTADARWWGEFEFAFDAARKKAVASLPGR